jgi:23S rRNA (cytosine1962-C5)-methyltransferase
MDPPSYGRGPSGEVWKLEENLYPFVQLVAGVLSDRPLFFLINSYTTGLSASVLQNILQVALPGGNVDAQEIGLPIRSRSLVLPCGSSGRWAPV